MALKKSEIRLLVILGVVVLGAGINFMIEGAAKKKEAALRAEKRKQQQEQSQQAKSSRELPIKVTSTVTATVILDSTMRRFDDWGRDPFTPDIPNRRLYASNSGVKSKKIQHEIKGFFWKSGKAYVLIDDYVFSEGEENNGLIVENIDGMSVLCREGNRSFTLTWRESL